MNSCPLTTLRTAREMIISWRPTFSTASHRSASFRRRSMRKRQYIRWKTGKAVQRVLKEKTDQRVPTEVAEKVEATGTQRTSLAEWPDLGFKRPDTTRTPHNNLGTEVSGDGWYSLDEMVLHLCVTFGLHTVSCSVTALERIPSPPWSRSNFPFGLAWAALRFLPVNHRGDCCRLQLMNWLWSYFHNDLSSLFFGLTSVYCGGNLWPFR